MFNDNQFVNNFRSHLHMMGRHHGGRGSGHFSGGFGFGRGGNFRTGRKFAAPDLQLVILALLAEKPSHGYELIKALEERSGGFYVPSPGMIYPALTYLEEVGYANFEVEGSRKLYRITAEGQRYLDENRSSADTMLNEMESIGGKMANLRRAFDGEEVAGEEFPRHGSREVHAARHELGAALRQKHRCSPEEAQRIAGILKRAAAEIQNQSQGQV